MAITIKRIDCHDGKKIQRLEFYGGNNMPKTLMCLISIEFKGLKFHDYGKKEGKKNDSSAMIAEAIKRLSSMTLVTTSGLEFQDGTISKKDSSLMMAIFI